jgi:hypothetical protein
VGFATNLDVGEAAFLLTGRRLSHLSLVPPPTTLTFSLPMNVVYGKPTGRTADGKWVEIKMRCRLCTGLVKKPNMVEDDEPVCNSPNTGYNGHDWTSIVNPLTNFFRQLITDFWKRECAAYASLHPEAGDVLRVQDLPMIERQVLKNKLDAVLKLAQGDLHDSFGYTVRLQFTKPPRSQE